MIFKHKMFTMDSRALLWLFLILSFRKADCDSLEGPTFLQEPPSKVEFSNNTRVWVSCRVLGNPRPSIRWTLASGMVVGDIHGVRTILTNGTIIFHSFQPEQYRQDVHAVSYRCEATSTLGTVVSREMWVRAVVIQKYEVQVYDEFVITGNTGVLKCHIPSFVTDYVTVTDWIQETSGSVSHSKSIVQTDDKYIVLPSGELHVRSVHNDDGQSSFSCRTYHRLTGETKISSTAGRLIVTAPQGSVPPRITNTRTTVEVEEGTSGFMPCAAQGHPVPSYSWFVKRAYERWEPLMESLRVKRLGGSLVVHGATKGDSSVYLCVVNNSIGSEKTETTFVVTIPLSVKILPSRQVVDLGNSARLKCFVTGYPVISLTWLRNGQQLTIVSNPSVPNSDILQVDALKRSDIGMYQCFARNNNQVVHGVAELRIGDAIPELHQTFVSRTIQPGTMMSLSCSASGNPQPEISWLLDDMEVPNDLRYVVGAFVSNQGYSVGYLNITSVRVEDGGEFQCAASNRLGSVAHSSRINIFGPPYIRPSRVNSAMAGNDVIIKCPYNGYPIEAVYWEKDSLKLPLNRRQRVFPNGTLQILNVQAQTDAGRYTCIVQGSHGQTASSDIEVAVLVPPGIAPFSFQGDQFVEGMRVRATCYVSKGDLPISISWLKDGNQLNSGVGVNIRIIDEYSNLLTIDSVTQVHSGNYTCQAKNLVAVANYTAHLIVNVPPRWLVEPRDVDVLVGENATLDCAASGSPHPTITWLKAEGSVPGDYHEVLLRNPRFVHFGNGSLLLSNLLELDEGEYLCQASNGIGPGLSRVVHVGVNVPPYFEQRYMNYTLSKGEEARLSCTAYGDLPITITWLIHGDKMFPMSEQNLRYLITEKLYMRSVMSDLFIKKSDNRDTAVFTCLANNTYGKSEAFIQLIVQEPPDPPANLKAIDLSSRSVRLSWISPFDGNTPVIRFVVQYKKSGEAWSMNSASQYASGTETSTSVVGLLPNTQYQFRVLAENKVGLSPTSEVFGIATEQEAPGGSPQNVEVQATDSQTLKITWLPPKKDLLHGEILGYNIGYRVPNSTENFGFRKLDIFDPQRKSYQYFLTKLRKFVMYGVVVQAFNRHGNGPNSPEISAFTLEDVPTKPPRHISCTAISSQSLRLTWDPPPPEEINGLLQGYKVLIKKVTKWTSGSTGFSKMVQETQMVLHGLDINVNYTIQVLGYTRIGDGLKSDVISCSTDEDVPDSPANIKALVMGSDVILLVWSAPIKSNGVLARYTVYVRILEKNVETDTVKHSVTPSKTYFEVLKVGMQYQYEFWVTASTAVGEGKSTKVISKKLTPIVPAKVAAFDKQITTQWRKNITLPCPSVGQPRPDTEWRLGSELLEPSERLRILPNGSLEVVSVRSLDTANYTCQVKNIHGSDSVTYQLIILAPPSPPQFTVSSVSLHKLNLQWTATIDGGSPIIGYSLSYRREKGEWEEIQLEPDVRSYSLESLWCGTRYELYMTAYSGVGPGKPSDIIGAKTKGSVPVAPQKDVVITNDASSLTLSLDGWDGDGCPILYFVIEYKKQESVDWILVSNYIKPQVEPYVVGDLQPNSRYLLRLVAQNRAGSTISEYDFATQTYYYEKGTSIPTLAISKDRDDLPFYLNLKVTLPVVLCCLLATLAVSITCFCLRHKRTPPSNPESQPLQLKYKLVTDKKTNGEVPLPDRFPLAPSNSPAPIATKTNLAEDVSPYATFQVAGHEEQPREVHYTSLKTQHSQPDFQNSNLEKNISNYSKVVKRKPIPQYRTEPSFSDDTVPDLLYHSQESSSSAGSSPDIEDDVRNDLMSDRMYSQHPPTHADLQRYLNSCADPDDITKAFEVVDFPPAYVDDYYALPESDYNRDRMMDCMRELKSVIGLENSAEVRQLSSLLRNTSVQHGQWTSRKNQPKQTIL